MLQGNALLSKIRRILVLHHAICTITYAPRQVKALNWIREPNGSTSVQKYQVKQVKPSKPKQLK